MGDYKCSKVITGSQQQFLLLIFIGVSWLFEVTATTVAEASAAASAFVGSRRHLTKHNKKIPSSPFVTSPIRTLPVSPSVVLFATTNSTSSSSPSAEPQQTVMLLEGKLTVLQEVVKEMDDRHKLLKEESDTAESDYQQKLENLQRDLEESIASSASRETALEGLRQSLTETREKHAREMEALGAAHNDEIAGFRDVPKAHQKELEDLERGHRTIVDRLQEELEASAMKMKEVSEKCTKAEEEASEIRSQNEGIVEELRSEIKEQRKQLAELATQQQQQQQQETESLSSSSSSFEEEKKNDEFDISKQLEEAAATATAEAMAKAEAASQEKLSGLQTEWEAQQKTVLENHKTAIDALVSEKQGLATELSELTKSYDEQIEIATSAVKAGETREEGLRSECQDLKQSLKQQRLLARVANLASDRIDQDNQRLSDENKDLSETNERLLNELEGYRGELDECYRMREKDQQLLLLQKQKQKSSLWGKVRSLWSRQ